MKTNHVHILFVGKLHIMAMFFAQAHIRLVLLQQLSEGLKQGDKKISRLAQHPAWLSNEDAQEHSTHLQLTLPICIRYCEVLRKLHKHTYRHSQLTICIPSHKSKQKHTSAHFTFQLISGLSFCCLKCLQQEEQKEKVAKK